jgi:hypothetical protein
MENFTNIDLGSLEVEWLRQPRLYGKYSAKLADAKKDLSEAKAAEEVTEAEVKRRIRRNPQKYGMNKITEPAVKETMVLHPLYQRAVAAVNSAKHVVDVLEGLINTLEHRKRTLENLVTLHGQNYFSKPKSPKGYGREMEDSLDMVKKRKLRGKGLRTKK